MDEPKKILVIASLFLAVAGICAAGAIYLTKGSPNPQALRGQALIDKMKTAGVADFSLLDISNRPLRLYDIETDYIIVNFWASWCQPCIEEFPSLVKLAQDNKGTLTIIAASIDDDEQAFRNFLKVFEWEADNFIIVKDPGAKTARSYGVTAFPESFVIDSSFRLKTKYIGAVEWHNGLLAEWK